MGSESDEERDRIDKHARDNCTEANQRPSTHKSNNDERSRQRYEGGQEAEAHPAIIVFKQQLTTQQNNSCKGEELLPYQTADPRARMAPLLRAAYRCARVRS
jgi:hypothetical protein